MTRMNFLKTKNYMKPISLFFMKSTLTTILFMLIALTSISQYEEHVNYHITVVDGMSKAEEGTFQLTITPKFKPVFTDDLLYFIEAQRDENKDVRISLMDCAELFIPSREKVNSPSFVALDLYSH